MKSKIHYGECCGQFFQTKEDYDAHQSISHSPMCGKDAGAARLVCKLAAPDAPAFELSCWDADFVHPQDCSCTACDGLESDKWRSRIAWEEEFGHE